MQSIEQAQVQPQAPETPAPAHAQATTAAGSSISSYRWTMAALLVVGTWAFTLPSLSFGLLLPAIKESLELSNLQSGWLGSSLRFGNVLVSLPAAVLLSRVSPVRLNLLSIGVGAGFTFMQGLAQNFAMLLVARLGFGIAFSMKGPARALLAQQWFPLREIPLLNGLTIGLGSVAEAVALALTPFILAATDSWRMTYHIYGFAALAVLACWLVLGRDRASPDFLARLRSDGRAPFRWLLRHQALWLVGLGTLGTTFGWWAFAVFWPTFMLEEHDIPLKETGFVFSLISVGTIPSSLFFGFFATRFRRRRLLLLGSGLALAGSSFGMLYTTSTPVLAAMALVAGIGWGHLPIALSVPYELPGVEPREVAIGVSLISTLMMVGGILGPLGAGAISEATGSLLVALAVGAACPISLSIASLFLPDRRPG